MFGRGPPQVCPLSRDLSNLAATLWEAGICRHIPVDFRSAESVRNRLFPKIRNVTYRAKRCPSQMKPVWKLVPFALCCSTGDKLRDLIDPLAGRTPLFAPRAIPQRMSR